MATFDRRDAHDAQQFGWNNLDKQVEMVARDTQSVQSLCGCASRAKAALPTQEQYTYSRSFAQNAANHPPLFNHKVQRVES
jgi:hypothetical protein